MVRHVLLLSWKSGGGLKRKSWPAHRNLFVTSGTETGSSGYAKDRAGQIAARIDFPSADSLTFQIHSRIPSGSNCL